MSDYFDRGTDQMEEVEEPMKFFSQVDKFLGMQQTRYFVQCIFIFIIIFSCIVQSRLD